MRTRLLQEEYRGDPWRVLVVCIFLNNTSAARAAPFVRRFFERWPSAEHAAQASTPELMGLLKPLGLGARRAYALIRMSREYLGRSWSEPQDLYGIGPYAADAFRIFVRGEIDFDPLDKKLHAYVQSVRDLLGK